MTAKAQTPPTRWPVRPTEGVELAIALAAVLLAFGALLPFYGGLSWVLPVVGGLLLGAGLVVLFRWRRLPSWALAPAAVLVTLVYELFALHASKTIYGLPGPAALRALGDGVVSGWARMLTSALPADATGDLLALPTAVAVAAGVVTTVLVLGRRTVIGPAAVPVAVLVVGLLLTASATIPVLQGVLVTSAMLGAVLVLLLVRANRLSATDDGIAETAAGAVGIDLAARRRHSTTARVLIGLPAAVATVALAAAGAVLLPVADGQDRADPRALYQPEVQLTARLSPLVEVKPQLLVQPPVALYRVTLPRAEESGVGAVRVAALDQFDGALWSQSGPFVVAGSALPQPEGVPTAGSEVTAEVEVLSRRSPFLPVVGVPLRTDGVRAAVDVASGSLVDVSQLDAGDVTQQGAEADAGTTGGPNPLRYTVTGRVLPPDGADAAPIAPASSQYTVLPDPPAWVRSTAEQVVAGQSTVWTQLQAIEKALWDSPYSVQARPGQSYGAVQRMLLGPEQDRLGYAEQHASAFAMMARSLGYPTRIAVGYRLEESRREGETYTVTTADAHAWPEVQLEGYGWMPFEPTNTANDVGAPPPQSPEIPPLPDEPSPPQAAEPDEASDTGASEGRPLLVQTGLVGLILLLCLVAAAILVAAGTVVAKVVRRGRRSSLGTPARRVAGAWQEAVDRLREAGHPVPAWQTPTEVVHALTSRTPSSPALLAAAPHLTELALIATTAVCSPTPPTSVAAKRAWKLQDQAARALVGRQSLPARVRALLDPRPLLPGASRLRRAETAARPGKAVPSTDIERTSAPLADASTNPSRES